MPLCAPPRMTSLKQRSLLYMTARLPELAAKYSALAEGDYETAQRVEELLYLYFATTDIIPRCFPEDSTLKGFVHTTSEDAWKKIMAPKRPYLRASADPVHGVYMTVATDSDDFVYEPDDNHVRIRFARKLADTYNYVCNFKTPHGTPTQGSVLKGDTALPAAEHFARRLSRRRPANRRHEIVFLSDRVPITARTVTSVSFEEPRLYRRWKRIAPEWMRPLIALG